MSGPQNFIQGFEMIILQELTVFENSFQALYIITSSRPRLRGLMSTLENA